MGARFPAGHTRATRRAKRAHFCFDLGTGITIWNASRQVAAAPRFAVQLVRNSGGAAVDTDHDGLPDVWPRVFLVRLDPSDPSGLTQYVSPDLHTTRRQMIPAAVDPTPFLPALQPHPGGNAPPVLTDKLSIVVRPALFDAGTPGAPPQRLPSLQPGTYRIVLVAQTGQAWQVPNEAGSSSTYPTGPSTTCR